MNGGFGLERKAVCVVKHRLREGEVNSIDGKGNGQPATPPRAHILDSAPPKESALLAAIVVFTTSRGFQE